MSQSKREDLRKVIVSGDKRWGIAERFAYFHRWAPHSTEGEQWVSAVVEYEDGRISEILPQSMQFVETFHRSGRVSSDN